MKNMSKLLSHAKKSALAIGLAAATVAGSLAATTSPADARWRGHGGGALAAGIIGGLALGALAGNAYGYYGPPAYYGPVYGPVYRPVYGPRCWIRHRAFINRFGHRVVRPVRICR
jgi:hypothetical protein